MYVGNIELNKLIGAEIHEREFNGSMVKCISIPLDINGMSLTDSMKVYLHFSLKPMRPNRYNQTHYMSLEIKDKYIRDLVNSLGFEKSLKFIGNATLYDSVINGYRKRVFSLDEAMDK